MRGGRFALSDVIRMAMIFAVLYGYWLLLSGHYTTWLNVSGALIVAITVIWAFRIELLDREGVPSHLVLSAVTYWPWLVVEIIKAALDVSWRIIHPSLPISPDLRRVKASQKTPEGLTTYANSITLTPGTISVLVDSRQHEIVVHGLSQDGLDGVSDGTMDAYATAIELGYDMAKSDLLDKIHRDLHDYHRGPYDEMMPAVAQGRTN